MNSIESYTTPNPYGLEEECAKLTIADPEYPFVLHNVMVTGLEYTLSFWIKSDIEGSIIINGKQITVSPSWTKHIFTFTASGEDIAFTFITSGVFFVYCPKLEKGNKATDWTPAPEDVDSDIDKAQLTADHADESATLANERVTTAESLIQQLSNCIAMLVTDENGESLMTQTENGWTFSMKETAEAVSSLTRLLETLQQETGSTQATVDTLRQAVSDHGETLEYVTVTTYEDEPCVELGESDSDFKLLTTNTRIMFRHGSNVPTLINTNGIVTQNIEVKGNIVQGGYAQLNTADGGWGLLWIGVGS